LAAEMSGPILDAIKFNGHGEGIVAELFTTKHT
jgi:hypothetical protein